MNISKTSVTGWVGSFLWLMALLTTIPTELQASIMSLAPKPAQPWLAVIFAFAAFIVKGVQGQQTQDKLKETPPETTIETTVVSKEKVVTLPPNNSTINKEP